MAQTRIDTISHGEAVLTTTSDLGLTRFEPLEQSKKHKRNYSVMETKITQIVNVVKG